VGSLMAGGAETISTQREAFLEKMRQLELRRQDVTAQKGRVESLGLEVVANTAAIEALKAAVSEVESTRLDPRNKEVAKKQKKKKKIEDEILASWEEINTDPAKAAEAHALLALIEKRRQLRLQAEASTESRENELTSLKAEAASLQADLDKLLAQDTASMLDGDAQAARSTLTQLQQSVGRLTRESTETLRSLDALPTKAELLQYERRFTELHSEVSWKYEETKQCFSRYNTISEKAANMKKEINLLHSVKENFETIHAATKGTTTKANKAQQDELLANIDGVVATIREATEKQKNKLSTEKEEHEKVVVAYNAVLAKQRSYFASLKALQNAVMKNTELTKEKQVSTEL